MSEDKVFGTSKVFKLDNGAVVNLMKINYISSPTIYNCDFDRINYQYEIVFENDASLRVITHNLSNLDDLISAWEAVIS
jgi:hypothetical protein